MTGASYDETIAWAFSLHRFGMKLGLENIRALLEGLGRPQDRFESVLVAGTNGKGSTAAMLHEILLAAGIRSGLYTSPHLLRTEERIRIGKASISPEELAGLLSEIRTSIDRNRGGRGDGQGDRSATPDLSAHPTFFEVLTAAALLAFARAEVEVAVLEVGLGGRLDATNAVSPVLSVITSIDLDHQEQLGSTHAAIAREKAGILRRGVPALLGRIGPEALEAIREQADAIGALLIETAEDSKVTSQGPAVMRAPERTDRRTSGVSASRDLEPFVQTFDVTTPVRRYPSVLCPLPGVHQRANALLAVRAAELLDERLARGASGSRDRPPVRTDDESRRKHPVRHARIGAEAIVKGIASVHWPGRLEWTVSDPSLLLDGAHNPSGCAVLAEYLDAIEVRPVLLFAAMRDKDVGAMLELLLPRVSTAVFTMPPSARACEPAELLECAHAALARLSLPSAARHPAGAHARARGAATASSGAAPTARQGPDRARTVSSGKPVAKGADEIALLRGATCSEPEIEPLHNPAEARLWSENLSAGTAGAREGYFADGDVGSALALARRLAGSGGTVLVAGSLFLVGAVKEVLAGLPVRAGSLA